MKPGVNYYDLLGISRSASLEEIREAYFEAARRYHPDVNSAPDANERFATIQQAYEVLQDEKKREQYDHGLPKAVSTPEIRLDVHYSVAAIAEMDQAQLVYALLEFNCEAKKENLLQPPPLHVSLVLDCSTSMQGERLDLVKTNVIHLLRRLRVQDILSVVAFNDRAEKLILDARGAEHKSAENIISLLAASGGTEIFKGLEAGISLLRSSKGRATRLLILITDGYTYGDEQACLDLAKQARDDGVVFHAAGIGSEWNDTLLDKLAALTGGSTEFITQSKDLFRFFEKQIDSMERLYARGLRLSGASDEGVELRAVCRISPEALVLPIEYPLALGSLLMGKPLSVLFEFLVHPIQRHFKSILMLDGLVKVELVNTSIGETTLNVKLKRPFGESEEEFAPPLVLLDAVSRYNLYRLQDRARADLAAGNVEQATKLLQNIATHLLAQGKGEIADMVIDEVRTIQHTRAFSEEGGKRVKYGTRALMLPSGMEEK